MKKNITLLFALIISLSAFSEDGSRLWLRYSAVNVNKNLFSGIIGNPASTPCKEFDYAWKSMGNMSLTQQKNITDKILVIGTGKDNFIQSLKISKELKLIGTEGYLIRSLKVKDDSITVIAANTDAGLLYGVYHLLRLIQVNQFTSSLDIKEKPSYSVRILNHWDNLNGSVERGYAGHSIFWRYEEEHPTITNKDVTLWTEYARANASIGINGTALNNVNAMPKVLSGEYLQKVKAIAGVMRPYGIKVYLSINFSSPTALGGLKTSDPLNKDVVKWWNAKTKEIYQLIPDFGGFLVKANSEGLPGPQDFGRTHADGANMLADALKPYGGIVMWRAFVYNPDEKDRAKQAYKEFLPLDGQFRDNVIVQVKNGPIDFQPREAFSPLFGAMKKTALMPELQITQEYLGQGNHLVFLSTMWKEFLDTDTHAQGNGTTIAKLSTGQVYPQKLTAIAGVANIGDDANWCGHHFAQANWYAFGRLAWNNELTSEEIANEWITMTFNNSTPASLSNDCHTQIEKVMLLSREAVVNYMMPLGLHHLFAWGHHYGPEPWCAVPGARPDWLPSYYHKADSVGLGFDRSASGSNAVSQYAQPVKEQYDDLTKCPENLILWFHHVPWDYPMKNGRTLWEELCYTYDSGVMQIRDFQKIWDRTEPCIDAQRFSEIQSKLRIQVRDAVWWKDACLLYFQTYSKRQIPYDIERPVHDLDDLKKIKLDLKQHN